jgi:hypothetical protein
MTYTPHQLRLALINEHAWFAHDDDSLPSADEYKMHIAPMLYDELLAEIDADDIVDLDFYMSCWLPESER